jgi:N-acetyl-anhydromuramyl-L-alanine amidase AmpD
LNLAELRVQDLEREGGKLRRELGLAQQTVCEQAVRIAELERDRLDQVIAGEDAAMDFPFIPAKHFRPGRERFVDLIVIHVMDVAETAEGLARYFAEPPTRVSAHLCIDDRSIVQCVRFEDTAFHCRNANADGIGIVHVGRHQAGGEQESREEWFDERGIAMLDLSAWAAAGLCRRYNIPVALARFAGAHDPKVVQRGFVGHRDVPRHGEHTDPGESFPWEHYLDRVRYHLALMD